MTPVPHLSPSPRADTSPQTILPHFGVGGPLSCHISSLGRRGNTCPHTIRLVFGMLPGPTPSPPTRVLPRTDVEPFVHAVHETESLPLGLKAAIDEHARRD